MQHVAIRLAQRMRKHAVAHIAAIDERVLACGLRRVGRAHGEAFTRARPATTGIVTELLDPRWLVEIEAEAVILSS